MERVECASQLAGAPKELHAGWVKKEAVSSIFKTKSERWLVLTTTSIVWYERPDGKEKGSMDLIGTELCDDCAEGEFAVKNGSRTLACETEDAAEWSEQIQAAVDKLKRSKKPSVSGAKSPQSRQSGGNKHQSDF